MIGRIVQHVAQPRKCLLERRSARAQLLGRCLGKRRVVRANGRRVLAIPCAALALIAILLLARLMVHSGMIETLAAAAADSRGSARPLASPIIGALGSFVTGSATASNIVLADFQLLQLPKGVAPLLTLAGQGLRLCQREHRGATQHLAGAATVGLIGDKGNVLKRTLLVGILYALAGGALLLDLSTLWANL